MALPHIETRKEIFQYLAIEVDDLLRGRNIEQLQSKSYEEDFYRVTNKGSWKEDESTSVRKPHFAGVYRDISFVSEYHFLLRT